MSDDNPNPALGCLWLVAIIFFVPAGYIATAIWPDQTANQFVGRTFLIGLGMAAAVLVIGVAAARNHNR
jgi:hypothetical protein